MATALEDSFGLAGTVLEGQYRADAVIGEGGFGVVYRGKHLSLDQPIAIKVLKGLDGGDPTINALVLEKFRAEARLLYTLSQSSLHIVRALDFGASSMPSGAWAPFMILEWLDGRSLAEDLVERHRAGQGGRSIAEAFALLEPVAEGLATAHGRSVAHRDVKPANIFLLRGGGPGDKGPRVKVLDFGIAKIMKEGEAAGTRGTFASFTWLYAAPEQLDPRIGQTGLATDVYAFGLVLTEVLAGRRPIDGRNVVDILKAATDPKRRPTPRTLGANIPDELEAVCSKALAVHPKDRYPTIAELWAALAAAREASTSSRGTVMTPSVAQPSLAQPPFTGAAAFNATQGPVGSAQGTHPMAQSGGAGSSASHTPRGARTSAMPMTTPMTAASPPAGNPAPPAASPPGTSPANYIPTPSPSMLAPPPMTSPPMTGAPMTSPPYVASPPYAASPPPGTQPPRQPFARRVPLQPSDGSNPVVILTIVFFALAFLFAGTCAAIHGACDARPASTP